MSFTSSVPNMSNNISYTSNNSDLKNTHTRLIWLDIAKGIGIILVVIGHSIGGIIDSNIFLSHSIIYIFFILYIFHMPLFFMLSGILVTQRIARNVRQFGKSLILKIAYPYFLWSTIQLMLIWSMSGFVNSPLKSVSSALLQLPLIPTGQFWFLQSLFVMHFVSFLFIPRVNPAWLLIASIVLHFLGSVFTLPTPLYGIALFYFYYMVGVVFGPFINISERMRQRAAWFAAATFAASALLVIIAIITLHHSAEYTGFFSLPSARIADISWSSSFVFAAIVFTAAIIYLSHFITNNFGRVMAYLGALSFPIYILHIIFVSGSRIVFIKLFGISDYALVLPAICTVGLVGPIITFEFLKKIRLAQPLGLI